MERWMSPDKVNVTWDHDLWDVVTVEPIQALRLRQDHASKAWFVVGLYD